MTDPFSDPKWSDDELPLVQELGLLRDVPYRPYEWQYIGMVEDREKDWSVEVRVMMIPVTKFFQFTINRRKVIQQRSKSGQPGEVRAYRETIIVSTGSGSLDEYWPTAQALAYNMIDIGSWKVVPID